MACPVNGSSNAVCASAAIGWVNSGSRNATSILIVSPCPVPRGLIAHAANILSRVVCPFQRRLDLEARQGTRKPDERILQRRDKFAALRARDVFCHGDDEIQILAQSEEVGVNLG